MRGITHRLTFRMSATSAYNKRAQCGSKSQSFANEPTCPKCRKLIEADKAYIQRMIDSGRVSGIKSA